MGEYDNLTNVGFMEPGPVDRELQELREIAAEAMAQREYYKAVCEAQVPEHIPWHSLSKCAQSWYKENLYDLLNAELTRAIARLEAEGR